MSRRRLLVLGLFALAATGLFELLVVAHYSSLLAWISIAVTALAAIVLIEDHVRRQVRPLRAVGEATRRIAAGEFGHKVYPGSTAPEVGDLARAFNAMSEQLAERFGRLEDDLRQVRAVLSGMVEGVVSLDAGQRILFANERAGRFLNFDPETAVGRKFWEVVRHRRLQQIVAGVLAGGESGREDLNWTGPAVTHLSVYVTRLSGGPAPGAVLVLHDTSDVHRLERVRQEFVANVSHELKTPLAVIKASVETLLNGAAADPDHRGPFLEQIDEQTDRLDALIMDLLSLGRIESGEAAMECQPVPLERAVRDCLDRHRGRAEAKRLTLESVLPADGAPITAWADEEALDTILDNLVDNAIKYTPAGGRVCVGWGLADGQAWLKIEDSGIGIPERDLPRIFERFYRVDKARSRELGGTGLGLSIVKHLVQTLRGSVSVESVAGKGTTFFVQLPLGPQP
jgi:two-component system, OmpR family, phosphate regulon sensor histidine kinase PhoR